MKRYKRWNLAIGIWLLAVGILLLTVACSKESDQTVSPTPAPSPTPGGQTPSDKPDDPDPTPNPPVVGDDDKVWLVATTRAGVDDDNEVYSPIQIFLISGASQTSLTTKREGQFLYDGGWYSTIGIKETDPSACIYGFSPANAAQCAISPLSGTSYHTGAILEMTNLKATSGDDLCVIVGVKHAETAIDAQGIPKRGDFSFDKGSDNYVGILLDHLFARIDFKVKVDADYSKRRHVKIKKLELQSLYELKDVTVKLTAGSDAIDVDYKTQLVTNDAEKPTAIVYDFTDDTDTNNKMGKPLTTDGTIFPGYFMADAESMIAMGLSLVCTYDVYAVDTKNMVRERVRENCVAINSLKPVFTSLDTPLKRGQKTTLLLTVKPTYIYQLSDDELDNPGISMMVEH